MLMIIMLMLHSQVTVGHYDNEFYENLYLVYWTIDLTKEGRKLVISSANIPLICIMTSQGLMPARNAGLCSHRPENFDSGHFELFNFPGR